MKNLPILAALAAVVPVNPAAAAGGAFSAFEGSWSGEGSLATASGVERLRCRIRYDVSEGGSALAMHLACASDAARLGIEADVRERGGAVSGGFTETSRNVSGSVSGAISRGRLVARVSGLGLSATLVAATEGRRQSVAITPDGGAALGVRSVSLNLSRR